MTQEYLIGYYRSERTKGKNAQWKYHVLYNFNQDWEENVLARRGLCGNRKFFRNAHPNEIETIKASKRAVGYRYKTLEQLRKDEQRQGTPPDIIDQICEALK
jgi:hypothetical protein